MKKILIVVGVIFLAFLFGSLSSTDNNGATNQETQTQETKQQEQAPTPKYEYEIISKSKEGSVENVSVLISPEEENSRAIADEVLADCGDKCNVTLFDDKKAYELDQEYTQMLNYETTVKERQAWQEKNTVFLAEHLIATAGYAFGPFQEYPLKDSYYRELKGQN